VHWVEGRVPYSQTGTYNGYRTDSAVFVSMSWELDKPGLNLSVIHNVATNITKDLLQQGDSIICALQPVLFAN